MQSSACHDDIERGRWISQVEIDHRRDRFDRLELSCSRCGSGHDEERDLPFRDCRAPGAEGLVPGTPVTLIESPDGIVLLTRDQLKRMVRRDLAGADLVAGLLAERRRAAADEDVASRS